MVPQVFSLEGHPYGLTVAGVQVITHVPLDEAPIRWERPGEGITGGISFTVEDDGTAPELPAGHVIRFTDNTRNELLWGGILVNRRYRRGPGPWATIEVGGAGWGLYIDRRTIPVWGWTDPVDGIIDYIHWGFSIAANSTATDQAMIMDLVGRYGGPIVAKTANVQVTASYASTPAADIIESVNQDLRQGLDSIVTWAESISVGDPPAYRRYYVDDEACLHYYTGSEVVEGGFEDSAFEPTAFDLSTFGPAPYHIGDTPSSTVIAPDSLTYEYAAESFIGAAWADASDGIAIGWMTYGGSATGVVPYWDAGLTQETFTGSTTDWEATKGEARSDLYSKAPITSLTFTILGIGGWRPGQSVIYNDARITGGVDETLIIRGVTGELRAGSVAEYTVTTGAPARSIVQVLASPNTTTPTLGGG